MQEQFIGHAGDGTQKQTPNSRLQIKWDSHDSDPFDPLGLLSLLVEQPNIEFVACKHGECVKPIRDVQLSAGPTAA